MMRTWDRSLDESAVPGVNSIGADLERVRLRRRLSQLEIVIARLNDRLRATDTGHVERAGLKRAIGDFRDELDEMRVRLAEITVPLLEPVASD